MSVTVLTCLCLNVLGPLLRRADERKEVPVCVKWPLPEEWSASVKDGWDACEGDGGGQDTPEKARAACTDIALGMQGMRKTHFFPPR